MRLKSSNLQILLQSVIAWMLMQHGLSAQTDTARLLPMAEITARRLDFFSIGQQQLLADSFTLILLQNDPLAQYLQAETALPVKTYGTGLNSLSIRGLPANQTAIVWNGINLQNPLNGSADLTVLSVGAAQRIGVRLGGCSALCGSGAIGGVVSLDHQPPAQEGLHGRVGYGLGSAGWRNHLLHLDYSRDRMGASVRVSKQSADNDFLFKNTAEIGQPLQRAVHAAHDFFNLAADLHARLSPRDFASVHFWHSQNYREITPTMTARNDRAFYRDTASRVVGEWTHFFKQSFVKTRAAYLFDKNKYASDLVKDSQNGVRSFIGEAEWQYEPSAKHRLRVGTNLTADRSDNSNYLENISRQRVALFVHEAFRSKWIDVTANIRQEWIGSRITPMAFSTGFEKKLFEKNLSKYRLMLRGALSRNFSIPTFNDLYWPQQGNSNLSNELGWSKELGLTITHPQGDNRLEGYLTLYDINVENRIVWQPQSDGQWRPTNLNRVQSRGIESGGHFLWHRGKWRARIAANYQLADATDGNGGVQLYVPKHNGSLSAWLQYGNASVSWQQTASSRRYGTTDQTVWTRPFALADASAGYTALLNASAKTRLKVWLDIRLRATNVLNADYQVIRFYPNPRRQFFVECNLRF